MSMTQICDNCKRQVEGLVQVAEPQNLYMFDKAWCFACVYEKGFTESVKRKNS